MSDDRPGTADVRVVSLPHSPNPLSRRRFLAGAGALAAAGLGGDAFVVEPRRVLVSRHELALPGLAPGLEGIRIAQLSDLHLPANRAAAERTLELLQRERPEIVVLTGDQCERRDGVPELVSFVSAARGRTATIAILGNWDYRGETIGALARSAYEQAGATLLINQHAIVERNGAAIAFAGVDDVLSGAPNLGAACRDVAPGIPTVLLVHEPGFADDLLPPGVPRPSAILAGHTHGGQIRLPPLPAYTPIGSGRYVAGWYDAGLGRLYVSRGIGTADIRARLFCPPELPIFTLRRA